MNAKNIISFTGGVMASLLGGIDTATSIIGLVIAFISLGLIIWDIVIKVKDYRAKKKKALEDGVITEEEQKQIDEAKTDILGSVNEATECLQEIKDNINRKG